MSSKFVYTFFFLMQCINRVSGFSISVERSSLSLLTFDVQILLEKFIIVETACGRLLAVTSNRRKHTDYTLD